jgi:hypothetical protein
MEKTPPRRRNYQNTGAANKLQPLTAGRLSAYNVSVKPLLARHVASASVAGIFLPPPSAPEQPNRVTIAPPTPQFLPA